MPKRYNILLDLDNTVISSISKKEEKASHRSKFSKFFWKNMAGEYKVFARPHLQEFLDFLFENFNVSVWTAASKSYAQFIIENFILVKPGRRLKHVFFSYHCKLSIDAMDAQKDLSMLWNEFGLGQYYERRNTYIIDDSEEVYNTQPDACILVKPFEFRSAKSHRDDELIENVEPVLIDILMSSQ